MPINPQIPLEARPPQIENPLDAFARAQALKNQMQQGQIQDIALQQARQQLQDQQIIRKAYMDSDGDLEDFMAKARRYGASPDTVIKLQEGILNQKKAYLQMTDEERKAHLAKTDMIRGMLTPIDQEQDDARAAQLFAQAYRSAEAQGLVDQQTKALLQQVMPRGFTRDGFKLLKNGLATGTALLKEANEAASAQGAAQRGQAAMITAQRGRDEADIADFARLAPTFRTKEDYARRWYALRPEIARMFPHPDSFDPATTPGQVRQIGMSPYQQAEAQKTPAQSEWAAKRDARAGVMFPGKTWRELDPRQQQSVLDALERAENANKVTIIKETAKARQAAGDLVPADDDPSQKRTIDDVPASIRPMVENILKYQSALPPQSRLNPQAVAQRWWVMRLDPNYSEELYPVRKATMLSMQTGKSATQLNAMNTVLGHVGALEEAVNALDNGNVRALNSIANWLGVQTGKDPVTTFKTIVHRVGPELTNAYVGSGGEASERKEAGGDFSENNSPAQIQNAARITAKLLASKITATLFQFRRGMHFAPGDPRARNIVEQFFTPEAREVMDRMFPGWQEAAERSAQAGAGPGSGQAGGSEKREAEKSPEQGQKPFKIDYRGKTYSFPTQKALDTFKTQLGIR